MNGGGTKESLGWGAAPPTRLYSISPLSLTLSPLAGGEGNSPGPRFGGRVSTG